MGRKERMMVPVEVKVRRRRGKRKRRVKVLIPKWLRSMMVRRAVKRQRRGAAVIGRRHRRKRRGWQQQQQGVVVVDWVGLLIASLPVSCQEGSAARDIILSPFDESYWREVTVGRFQGHGCNWAGVTSCVRMDVG
jgi:hypothetical protein